MKTALTVLDRYKWPLAVIVSVALGSWAALEIAVLGLELDPSTVETLTMIRGWAGRVGAGFGALLTMVLARDSNNDGVPDVLEGVAGDGDGS